MRKSKSGGCWPLERRYVAAILLVVSSLAAPVASQDCHSHFTVNGTNSGGPPNTVIVDKSVNETTPPGEELYTVTWDEDITPSAPTDPDFNLYFDIDSSTANTWIITVKQSLAHLPDAPNIQEFFATAAGFTFSDGVCTLQLSHTVLDENNQTPELDQPSYSVTVREDYPEGLQLNDVVVLVVDNDGTAPNNKFSMTVTGCPLKATVDEYGDNPGENIFVYFELTEVLDYETATIYTCTISATDKGSPPLTSSPSSLTLSVEDRPDEPPQFDYPYYFATADSSIAIGEVLIPSPAEIYAVDGDTSINSTIAYSMEDAWEDVVGTNYFTIDPATGEVSLSKDLDDIILAFQTLTFLITATDDGTRPGTSYLEVGLPWDEHLGDGLHFQLYKYATEVLEPAAAEVVIAVKAVTSDPNDTPTYTLAEENDYFAINPITGEITTITDDTPPGLYTLVAVATVPGPPALQDFAQVNIRVLTPSTEDILITQGLVRLTEEEGGDDTQMLQTFNVIGPVKTVCVVDVKPSSQAGKFTVQGDEVSGWALWRIQKFDYEEVQVVEVTVQAFAEEVPCALSTTSSELLRSQAMVEVSVVDVNDNTPQFEVPPENPAYIAYPKDEALQSVVGPLIILQASDLDQVGQLTYSLGGASASAFSVDEVTGEVYVKGDFGCDSPCQLTATVSDSIHESQTSFTVLSLTQDYIYTLMVEGVSMMDLDQYLQGVSEAAGVQVTKLYVSASVTSSTSWRLLQHSLQHFSQAILRDSSQWTLQVHVYSLDNDHNFLTKAQLNEKLSASNTPLQAEDYTEKDLFNPPPDTPQDTTGLKVAVGVLGALLGVILIAGVGFLIYKRKYQGWKRGSSSPISTLGREYPNHSYSHENDGSIKDIHMNGGSRGSGFEELQLQEKESVVLQESPILHHPNFTAISTSNDYMSPSVVEPQPNGLRYTDQGPPPSYDFSYSPRPPASLTTVQVETHPPPAAKPDPLPVPAPSMDPKPAPVLYSAPSSTSLRHSPGKSILKAPHEAEVPVSLLPVQEPAKPAEPDADYDDDDVPTNTRLTKLVKGSPPPRRAEHQDDDDDDDDETEDDSGDDGIKYPGGKKSNLKKEGAAEDTSEKSVAFKVIVQSMEFVPQEQVNQQEGDDEEEEEEAQEHSKRKDEEDEQSERL